MALRRRSKIILALGVFVFAVVTARLAAPVYILGYVNRTLEGLDGYTGHVGDIDLGIWRGAYVIRDLKIEKTTEKMPVPFVSIDQVDISVQWAALLQGSIVSEIQLESPKINIVAERKKESKQEDQVEKREKERVASGGDSSWQKQVKELVPFDINRVGVTNGQIHFRDPYSEPKVDVAIRKLRGQVTNITNSEELNKDLNATASFKAEALGSGELSLDGRIDPYAKLPTFSLNAQMENLKIAELNDFLKAYANVDAEAGTLSVYTEVNSRQGRFKGYVKPLIRDLKLLKWREEEEGFFGKLWEGIVATGKEILENNEKQQVATRIPLSGRIDQPEADIITTVFQVLRNAFIEALRRGLEPGLGEDGKSERGEEKAAK